MASPPKIKKLDEVVVNRIAAGEIIQRPANALKELIENSLDAKATDIQIVVKEGGLKLLQIQDNGTGIRKEDLDIVCERFTTSKLEKFEDLQGISTYGFRGEALASISHVSQLSITTKTAQGKVAYKASYIDGKLKSAPKPIAGNQGTTITIENLFYNVATRRKALENVTEQFSLIHDVVLKYAIHNSGVGFTLKKQGVNTPVLRTPFKATRINNIQSLFGNGLTRDLIEVNLEDKDFKFKVEALISNPFYYTKKWSLLLFINNRLVDNSLIKKMLEDIYSIYLPKRNFPWVYMSLKIDPQNVDVNIHPTKSEVRFIHEHKIIDKIRVALDDKLTHSNACRTFYVQTKLPEVDLPKEVLAEVIPEYDDKEKDKDKKVYAKNLVRIDHKEQKLAKFNFTINAKPSNQSNETHSVAEQSVNKENTDSTVNESLSDNLREEMNLDETNVKKREEITIEKPEETPQNDQEESNVDDSGLKSIDDNLQINSQNFVTSTQVEQRLENDQQQVENPLIPDSVIDLFVSDDSSSELPSDPIPMSKPAERAMKTVLRLFGSQPDSKKTADQNSHNSPENHQENQKQSSDDHQAENSGNKKIKLSTENEMNNSEAGQKKSSEKDKENDEKSVPEFKSYSINNFRREVHITSILQLRKSVEDTYHEGLRKLLNESKFIACVDPAFALIQSDVNLYICNTKKLAEELFYEIMLYDFANYGVLKFSEPLSITELSLLGLELEEAGWTESERPKKEIAEDVRDLLTEKAEMLKEYFSIVITKNGYIKSLPMLLENYYPSEVDLPLYILRMATEVNWDEEKPCFDGICRETAKLFSHINVNSEHYDWRHLTEYVLYATIKESLLPPKHFAQDSTILRIASLPDLYKLFERC
ncbi:DNA mismatch repair protein Mlh1 [Chelonus insularis]|uniref:DNA mismatch repair protein Mlh1 n=1 Tax=Chelonus insularis TaxID=460826 RepID=UPI00158B57B9|nr:DNA mismatch repair protein Mlh1 [Chelonus insularis]XP_034936973.1 DNA mismatch repair protein Mlh1 [Chelonus insularis]XP_034936974.1 DNA mismatch repair protein Mlh1 [Chelonus insularis]XP_034936976.1 DNA mismatch repair protein Mlh1 [Chelonus insularis]